MPNLVLLGIQGSGKGTQADLLRKNYGFTHLNVGSLLREQMRNKTEIGNNIEGYMARGDLVPDRYIFTLIDPVLSSKTSGLVLDGFPRTIKQAEYLYQKITVKIAIYFELDDEIAKERLSNRRVCQKCHENYNLLLTNSSFQEKCKKCNSVLETRSDDNKEAINRRIEAFHQQTKPVIKFFSDKQSLIKVNATDKPDIIHHKLVKTLNLTTPAIKKV